MKRQLMEWKKKICKSHSEEVEATQLPINGWMDKENVVYAYKRILFSLEKKGNYDTGCAMDDEPWGHYVK